MIDEALRQRNIKSARRFRWIASVLAIAIPAVLWGLFQRQNHRLRALVDHGQSTQAMLTQVTQQGGVSYSKYRYWVDGSEHEWTVSRAQAPYAPGETFPVVYLPEHPDLTRPVAVYTLEQYRTDVNLTFQYCVIFGIFAFFALLGAWSDRALRRLRAGADTTATKISPIVLGRIVAGLLYAVTLAVNLDPKVASVQVAAFGCPQWVISIVESIVILPLFWLFRSLTLITMDDAQRGGSLTKFGIVMAVARARPELRRARNIVIACTLYFLTLMLGWIAFASYRGV